MCDILYYIILLFYNISYYIISYHIILYYIVLYYVILYPAVKIVKKYYAIFEPSMLASTKRKFGSITCATGRSFWIGNFELA